MRSLGPLLLLAAACSGDDAPLRCPLGDPTAPAQVEIVHLDASDNLIDTVDVLPIRWLPQGNWGVVIGARATNIDGCSVTLATSYRDACETTLRDLETRTPQQLVDQGEGWGLTPFQDFSVLQTCPIANALRDHNGESFLFTVTVEDRDGQRASKEVRLAIECPADDPRCACECDRNYIDGNSCPPSGPPAEPAC